MSIIKRFLIAYLIGMAIGLLTYPVYKFYHYAHIIPDENVLSSSVYYSTKTYEDWYIAYKSFNHPARKFKFADTESNVVLVETNLGKTTFWTYILPE